MSSRTAIKANFQTGDTPTQANFEDLVDSLAHVSEDGLATTASVKFAVLTEATTARILALTDAQKYIRCTSGSATTITVPPQADVAWLDNTEIIIYQAGAGAVTIAAGSGVTINTPETLIAAKQYATLTLKRAASNIWDISGNLEAA